MKNSRLRGEMTNRKTLIPKIKGPTPSKLMKWNSVVYYEQIEPW